MHRYYVAVGAEQLGPYSLAELAKLPLLKKRTPVWRRGLAAWVRASELPELSELLAAPRPIDTGTVQKLELEPPPGSPARGTRPAVRIGAAITKFFAGVAAVLVLIKVAAPLIQKAPEWNREIEQRAREKARDRSKPTTSPLQNNASPSRSSTVVPRADVDERLYLIYDVRYTYQFMPTDVTDPAAFAAALGRQRHESNRRLEYVRARQLDPGLVTLYVDLIATIDAMTDIYVKAGRLSRDAVAQAEAIARQADIEGGETLASAGLSASPSGGLSLVAGGFDLAKQQATRDATTDQAKEAAKRAMEDLVRTADQMFSTYFARAEATVDEMARRYGWSAAEAGMVGFSADLDRFHAAVDAQDAEGVVAWMSAAKANRPRDPVVLLLGCMLAAEAPDATVKEKAKIAEFCYSTATLVPAGAAYDEDRATILLVAAKLMKDAAMAEAVVGGSWVDGGSVHATTSVRWFDVASEYAELTTAIDEDGEFRLSRAVALTVAGRPAEALEQAKAIHAIRSDSVYAYVMTTLLGKTGAHDESLNWFAYLLSVCPAEMVAVYRTDPALKSLRQARFEAYDNLLQIKFEWNIQWGALNDDIFLKNRSAFPLTNVVFVPRIENAGKVYAPELRVERIVPGQTHTWSNAVSVTGSRYDRANATLACDQGR